MGRLGLSFILFFLFFAMSGVDAKTALFDSCSKKIIIIGSNCENIFDPTDTWWKKDIIREGWSPEQLYERAKRTARLLTQDGKVMPSIVMMAEIADVTSLNSIIHALYENYGVWYQTAFLGGGTDERGIQVAALVHPQSPLGIPKEEIPHYPHGPVNDIGRTRNILELVFETRFENTPLIQDQIHIFMVHLPSLGNPTEARIEATQTIRKRINEILTKSPSAKLMVIGDFNTIPSDRTSSGVHPVEDILLKPQPGTPLEQNPLVDLYSQLPDEIQQKMPPGTYFYRKDETWSRLDRVLVSHSFIHTSIGLRIDPLSLRHYVADFASIPFQLRNGTQVRIPHAWGVRNHSEQLTGLVNQDGTQDHFPIIVEADLLAD